MSGEKNEDDVVAVGRRHWISLWSPLFWALILGVVGGAIWYFMPVSIKENRLAFRVLVAGGTLVWLSFSASTIFEWATTLYVITSTRVYMRRGLLRQKTTEVALAQVGRWGLRQGILGRLLKFGTVRLELRNGAWWTMRRLQRPERFIAGLNAAVVGAASAGRSDFDA